MDEDSSDIVAGHSVQYTENVASLLQELGYRAKIEPEPNIILSGSSGFKIVICCFPNDSLQIRCVVSIGDFKVDLRLMNDFNKSFRFCKLYLTDEADLCLDFDLFLDAHNTDAEKQLEDTMFIYDSGLRELRSVMTKIIEEAEPISSQKSDLPIDRTSDLPDRNTEVLPK